RGNVTLAVVGNGPLESELKRLAGSLGLGGAVRFCGSVAHEKLHVWYSAADLFCLTSAGEGWPNVLLESMACGTPVVATGVWGVPEVVRSDEVGLLTELDERAIARTVAAALGRPWDRERVRQYAEEHSWDHVARSVQDVFETVLNGQSSGRFGKLGGPPRWPRRRRGALGRSPVEWFWSRACWPCSVSRGRKPSRPRSITARRAPRTTTTSRPIRIRRRRSCCSTSRTSISSTLRTIPAAAARSATSATGNTSGRSRTLTTSWSAS